METIHPQSWDIPVDWVVTERGVYRRDGDKLAFLGEPPAGRAKRARLARLLRGRNRARLFRRAQGLNQPRNKR